VGFARNTVAASTTVYRMNLGHRPFQSCRPAQCRCAAGSGPRPIHPWGCPAELRPAFGDVARVFGLVRVSCEESPTHRL